MAVPVRTRVRAGGEAEVTNDELVAACVPLAARLAATVREYGSDDVGALMADVPEGRVDVLCIVLAAMVNPYKPVGELLAWTEWGGTGGLEYRRLLNVGVSAETAEVLAADRAA
jgi:hypothetical protein